MPAGVFAIGWVFLETADGVWGLLGLVSAVGAAITVYCTGMIHACLKTVRQWHHPLVTPLYLGFALVGGALWLNALVHLFGLDALWSDIVTLAALPVVWGVKLRYWRRIDSETGESTPETATGLGSIGKVRLLEPPHTEENYLLKKMGFTVASKHGEKLRRLALLSGLGGGLLFTLLAFLTPGPSGRLTYRDAGVASAGFRPRATKRRRRSEEFWVVRRASFNEHRRNPSRGENAPGGRRGAESAALGIGKALAGATTGSRRSLLSFEHGKSPLACSEDVVALQRRHLRRLSRSGRRVVRTGGHDARPPGATGRGPCRCRDRGPRPRR